MKISKNRFFFFQIVLISIIIGLLSSFILPSKFYNDAEIIVNDYYNEIGFFGAYPFTIFFYNITKLKLLPYFIVALIQLPILFYLVYKIGVPKRFNVLLIKNIVVYIGFFLIGLFICIPSKEFVNFVFLSTIVFLFKSKKYSVNKTLMLSFLLFGIFSIFFRVYFIFIPILSIGMWLSTYIKSKNKTLDTILYSIFVIILISITHGVIKGEYISESTRVMHNLERIGDSDAQSMIVSPVEASTWYGETFSVFYGYMSVNIPVTGLKHILKPQVIAFIIWQIFLFYLLFLRLKTCIQNKNELKLELWILFYVFSYFTIQALFEPDLGSAIRHKIGIFPLIYFALYYDSFERKI